MQASTDRPRPPQLATVDDVGTVTELLVDAFRNDPLWDRWAFSRTASRRDERRQVFRLFVEGALEHRTVWTDAAGTCATVWIPPGRPDLTDEQERILTTFVDELPSRDRRRIEAAFALLEQARPAVPHHHLSLFGTRPEAAGHGHGQRLLAANLEHIDRFGEPCFLDTSDELVALYARFGFQPFARFDLPEGGPAVNCLWRDAR